VLKSGPPSTLRADQQGCQKGLRGRRFEDWLSAPGRVSHAMSHSVPDRAHRGCSGGHPRWPEPSRGADSAGRGAGWVQRIGLGDRRSRVQISAARQEQPQVEPHPRAEGEPAGGGAVLGTCLGRETPQTPQEPQQPPQPETGVEQATCLNRQVSEPAGWSLQGGCRRFKSARAHQKTCCSDHETYGNCERWLSLIRGSVHKLSTRFSGTPPREGH